MIVRCPHCREPLEYLVFYTATLHSQVKDTALPGTRTTDLFVEMQVNSVNMQFSDLDIDYILCRNCRTHVDDCFDPAAERFDGRHLTIALSDTFVMESSLE